MCDLSCHAHDLSFTGSANSTECFHVILRQGDQVLEEFNPEFTYPIFGDEESIFGYRDLEINLSFAAHNLRPHLELKHDGIFPDQGDVKASDVNGALADFLPDAAITDVSVTDALRDSDAATFQPPGSKLHTYSRNDETFEIWSASLADPKAMEIFNNMQILATLMVEGATFLELDYDWVVNRWRLFLLYKIVPADSDTSKYALAGYATSYRIFTLAERSPITEDTPRSDGSDAFQRSIALENATALQDLCSRERISQFIILPPFQRSGHGVQLYDTIYTELTRPENVCELTVEDPNENFDILRDLCDLRRLRAAYPEFASLSVADTIPSSDLRSDASIPIDKILSEDRMAHLKRATKIAPRQWSRLVEMQTLSHIPSSSRKMARITRKEQASNPNDRAYYFWRLYTKHRLFQFNRDVLIQLDDRAERIEKLEQALDSLLGEYEEILEKAARSDRSGASENGDAANGEASRKRSRAGDGEEVDAAPAPTGRKRARVLADDDDNDDGPEDA